MTTVLLRFYCTQSQLVRCTTTKMKGLPRYLNGVAFFCLIGLHIMLVNVISIQAQGWTADQLLAQKEEELNRFVGVVEGNSRNCDALKSCSGVNCSRLACYEYGTPGDSNYKCLGVLNNPGCGSQCKERNFDYSKGFLRRVDTVDQNIGRTVCTQRTLDDHFRSSSISNSSHLFRVFFGSVDGTFRIYPGADESCNVAYDPRLRPWFLGSTYVPKAVIVLIDSGSNMRGPLDAGGKSETYIGKAKDAALKILETLREDSDYVNIMCFDGDRIIALNDIPTKYHAAQLYQAFTDRLAGIISDGSNNQTSNPSAVATGNAIETAISQLNSSIDPATHLKVIIVLTSGLQFQNLTQLNIPANSDVNVFMYNFHTTDRTAQCDPAIRAFSEQIPVARFDNPLYALESYYSFLAKIHKRFMGTRTDYGQQHEDYSGVDNSTLTISKAAFGPSGELLGVVGIDFFEKKVEEQYDPKIQFDSIVIAARNHPKITYQPNALTISVCFNHTEACPSLNTNVQGFLCVKKGGDKDIGCCGKCKAKKTEWGKIFGGVAAGIVGLLAVAAIVYCNRTQIARRLEHERKSNETPDFRFPGGPENGTVQHGDTTGNVELSAPR